MQKIRIATIEDYDWVVQTLICAFFDDELFNYYVRNDEKKSQALKLIFEFVVYEVAHHNFEILIYQNNALAILIPPNKKTIVPNFLKAIKIFWFATGGKKIFRLLRMALFLPQYREKKPHFYIWFLASNLKGAGSGGELLKYIKNQYCNNNFLLALETCSARNVKFYIKNGFVLREEFKIAKNSPVFYTMSQ